MRHVVSAICCLIVGLQVLVGVPLVVCLGFYLFIAGNSIGPVAFEVHTGHSGSPTTIPPPNLIPATPALAADNPILETRIQRGSPLTGTVLESESPSDEHDLFVAAIEKAAAEKSIEQPFVATNSEPTLGSPAQVTSDTTNLRKTANQFAVQHLYAIAESDEQAGEFERADQWRALAREIRRELGAGDSAIAMPNDTLSRLPAAPDSPF